MRIFFRLAFVSCLAFLANRPTVAAPPPPNISKTVTFIFLADDNGGLRMQNNTPFANGTGWPAGNRAR